MRNKKYIYYYRYEKTNPLLPCPFCGEKARFAACHNGISTDYRVECTKCWAETPRYTDPRAAWENWNRRSGEEYVDRYIADKNANRP